LGRLPLAISMNERLLVAVANSKAAVPVSASPGHTVAGPQYPTRSQGDIDAAAPPRQQSI